MSLFVAGNSALWRREELSQALEEKRVILAENLVLEDLKRLFETYHFDKVIYVSEYLNFLGKANSRLEEIQTLLKLCVQFKTDQVVFLSTASAGPAKTDEGISVRAQESLFLHYKEQDGLSVRIIRCPYLYRADLPGDYFYRLFTQAVSGKPLVMGAAFREQTNFLSAAEIPSFLSLLFDRWEAGRDIMALPASRLRVFGLLAWKIKTVTGASQAEFSETARPEVPSDDFVRRTYGWFAKEDPAEALPDLFAQFQAAYAPKKVSLMKRAAGLLGARKPLVIGAEMAVLWILVEVLMDTIYGTSTWNMVDLRLLFVVLMGSIYGMTAGTTAALLATIAVGLSYARTGLSWQVVFYQPINWLPFTMYFVTGAICGHVSQKYRDTIKNSAAEKRLLEEKYMFLLELYQEAVKYKDQYKKQIISSRDSFGKIFQVVRRLDTLEPREIYSHAIAILEDVMDTENCAFYSLRGEDAAFARLEVSSPQLHTRLKKSIRMDEYGEVLETLKKNEVWVNRELSFDFPMYVAGVRNREGKLILLIMLYQVPYNQMTLYYVNLFSILCGLIQDGLCRAWDYQTAIQEHSYIRDTIIMNEEAFLRQLQLNHMLTEQGVSSYSLLRFYDSRTPEEISRLLEGRIRDSDLLGMGGEGEYFLLLSQSDAAGDAIVLKRLESLGLDCRLVQWKDREVLLKR